MIVQYVSTTIFFIRERSNIIYLIFYRLRHPPPPLSHWIITPRAYPSLPLIGEPYDIWTLPDFIQLIYYEYRRLEINVFHGKLDNWT